MEKLVCCLGDVFLFTVSFVYCEPGRTAMLMFPNVAILDGRFIRQLSEHFFISKSRDFVYGLWYLSDPFWKNEVQTVVQSQQLTMIDRIKISGDAPASSSS